MEVKRLDEDFRLALDLIKSYIPRLKTPKDAHLCRSWLTRLIKSHPNEREMRNFYVYQLCYHCRIGVMMQPFSTLPENDDLQEIPSECIVQLESHQENSCLSTTVESSDCTETVTNSECCHQERFYDRVRISREIVDTKSFETDLANDSGCSLNTTIKSMIELNRTETGIKMKRNNKLGNNFKISNGSKLHEKSSANHKFHNSKEVFRKKIKKHADIGSSKLKPNRLNRGSPLQFDNEEPLQICRSITKARNSYDFVQSGRKGNGKNEKFATSNYEFELNMEKEKLLNLFEYQMKPDHNSFTKPELHTKSKKHAKKLKSENQVDEFNLKLEHSLRRIEMKIESISSNTEVLMKHLANDSNKNYKKQSNSLENSKEEWEKFLKKLKVKWERSFSKVENEVEKSLNSFNSVVGELRKHILDNHEEVKEMEAKLKNKTDEFETKLKRIEDVTQKLISGILCLKNDNE